MAMSGKVGVGARRPALTLNFIRAYMDEHTWAPSTREVAAHLRTSTSIAHNYLQLLQKQGLIERGNDYGSRKIRLTEAGRALTD
jgi:SOS-response transcriptional repressor LexA